MGIFIFKKYENRIHANWWYITISEECRYYGNTYITMGRKRDIFFLLWWDRAGWNCHRVNNRVSTIGVKKDENATKIWYDGMDEAIKRIKPSRVLVYGGDIGYKYPDGIKVRYYDNKAFKN